MDTTEPTPGQLFEREAFWAQDAAADGIVFAVSRLKGLVDAATWPMLLELAESLRDGARNWDDESAEDQHARRALSATVHAFGLATIESLASFDWDAHRELATRAKFEEHQVAERDLQACTSWLDAVLATCSWVTTGDLAALEPHLARLGAAQ